MGENAGKTRDGLRDVVDGDWGFTEASRPPTAQSAVSTVVALSEGASSVSSLNQKPGSGGSGGSGSTGTESLLLPEPAFTKLNQRRADMEVAARRIRSLYDNGMPVFRRETLRSLARQLDRDGVRNGVRRVPFTIQGIDGRAVQVPSEVGAVCVSDEHPEIVLINLKPQIMYWNIEKLTGKAAWHVRRFNKAQALLSTRITYKQAVHHRDATGFISSEAASSVRELASSLAEKALTDLGSNNSTFYPAGTDTRQQTATPPPFLRQFGPKLLSVDQVRAGFEQQCEKWEASEDCQNLRTALVAGLSPLIARRELVVGKIVAFACSTMAVQEAPANANASKRTRSLVQHAMVLTVRDVLEELQANFGSYEDDDDQGELGARGDHGSERENRRHSIQCFVQDPAYEEADRTVLGEAGLTVLDDPHGFLAVDETSVVITVAPSVPVRQIIADIARPAVMIWARTSDVQYSQLVENAGGRWDPASVRVRDMVQDGYRELDCPLDPVAFGTDEGMAMYVRTSSPGRLLAAPAGGDALHKSGDDDNGGEGGIAKWIQGMLCLPGTS